MARVFIFSDPHFGHENMAKRRGFESAEEQDELIVSRWNSVVNKNDKVFVLGDITMEKREYEILNRLKGQKTFILGNHDREQRSDGLIKYGNIAGIISYRGFWLSHAPIHPCELRSHYNIHGHTHFQDVRDVSFGLDFEDEFDYRYINVSAERINYTPILFEEILKMKKYDKRK